jgi:phosphopantetheinyl transferase (holo-ACP synthase)
MNRLTLPESWRGRAVVIGDAVFSNDWFSDAELVAADAFRLQKRTTEWKHGRIAAKQLALDLGMTESPRECFVERPWIHAKGERRYVSISHSGGYAAAAIDLAPVGIDVERLRDLRETAAHLFLTGHETADMRDTRIANRMLHFWAAKEAAWKQGGGEAVTLKRVPLKLEAETVTSLRFSNVETFATGDVVVALTRPTSAAGFSRR